MDSVIVTKAKDRLVNLCDTCLNSFPECEPEEGILEFGDGIGHDNIIACDKFTGSAIVHCLTCGTRHCENTQCPAGAFAIVKCKNCGNGSINPVDALFGLDITYCGQCDTKGQWLVEPANEDNIKEFWPQRI